MLSRIKDLFRYGHHMNSQMVPLLGQPNAPEQGRRLLHHIVQAQQTWLARVKGEKPDLALWDAPLPADLQAMLDNDWKLWQEYLNTLTEPNLGRNISYTNVKGEPFATPLEGILTHMANHCTHHRAQIALLLRQAGIAPPATDYINWLRTRATALS